jgi:hypothetical protein
MYDQHWGSVTKFGVLNWSAGRLNYLTAARDPLVGKRYIVLVLPIDKPSGYYHYERYQSKDEAFKEFLIHILPKSTF